MSEQTVKDWTVKELQFVKKKAKTDPCDMFTSRIELYQNDLKWFETDEPRTCWKVINLMGVSDCIFNREEEARDWNSDIYDPDEAYEIIEVTMTGREYGSLPFSEDW